MNHIRITAPVRGWEIGGGGAGRPVTREGKVSLDRNIIKVQGRTLPKQENSVLKVKVQATIA